MAIEPKKKAAAKKPAKKVTKKVTKKKEPKANGRPKVNPEDYNPDWAKEMTEAYSEGKSDVWVRARCFNGKVVSEDLWYRWVEEVDEFSLTVKGGKLLSQSHWEDVSQDHAKGINTDANATSLIFNMSNRFKDTWKQRQSVEQSTKVSLDMDEAGKLEEFLKEHGIDTSKI